MHDKNKLWVYIQACIHIYTYIQTYIHTYIHTYIRTYVHTSVPRTFAHTCLKKLHMHVRMHDAATLLGPPGPYHAPSCLMPGRETPVGLITWIILAYFSSVFLREVKRRSPKRTLGFGVWGFRV